MGLTEMFMSLRDSPMSAGTDEHQVPNKVWRYLTHLARVHPINAHAGVSSSAARCGLYASSPVPGKAKTLTTIAHHAHHAHHAHQYHTNSLIDLRVGRDARKDGMGRITARPPARRNKRRRGKGLISAISWPKFN